MKDRVFFTDKTEERKVYNIYFKDTMKDFLETNGGAPAEYYVKMVETDRGWDYHLCHVEYPFLLYMGGCWGYPLEQVFDKVEVFINDNGDEFIDLYGKKFLGK